MRVSKLQKTILEIMSRGSSLDDGTFFFQINELIERTGRTQQSVNRSLNLLVDRGVLVRKKSIGAINHNSWSWKYIRSDIIDLEIETWGEL